MKKHWWKILGVLCLTYAILTALTAKVGPGVGQIVPASVKAGSMDSITINGYNTSFTKAENIVRLKRGKFLIQSRRTRVLSDNELVAYFSISADIPDSMFRLGATVLIESEYDGLFGMPNAITIDSAGGDIYLESTTEVKFKKKSYFAFPSRHLLHETIRNLNFHVPMWFTMMTLMLISFIQSLKQLRTNSMDNDNKAHSYASVGVLFGLAGIITGAVWARFTWGTFWTNDPKLNGAAIGVMIYSAYLILRSSIEDGNTRAKVSAVYNVFAFPIFIVLILIYPKLAGYSLHPGSGDSVGFNTYDLDNDLRKVFYPAVLGWILLGVWISQLKSRLEKILWKIDE